MKVWKYLFFFLFIPTLVNAQLPFYGDGFIYRIGSTPGPISQHDPNAPLSATNPSQNTSSLTIPGGAAGLAVGENMFLNDGTYTFYTCVSGNYYYYDLASNSWINTGHAVGNTSAVNPGMGGGLMYNLVGSSGQIWVYDFTGPGTLLTTITDFGGGGPYDLVVDCLGYFYILRTTTSGSGQWMRRYDPAGNLDQQWGLVGAPSTTAGGGFAIVEDTVYWHNNSGLVTAVMDANNVNVINIQAGFASSSDYANIPIGAGPMNGVVDTMFVCESGSLTYHPSTSEQIVWTVVNGSPSISLNTDNSLNINYTGSFEIFIEGFSACAENNIVTDTLRLYVVDNFVQMPDTIEVNGCGSFETQINATITTSPSFADQQIVWSTNDGQITSGAFTSTPTVIMNHSGYVYLQITNPAPYGDCVTVDSVYIKATDYTISPSFTYALDPSCNFNTITVSNNSVLNNSNANHTSQWNFGDGTTSAQMPATTHVYDEAGFYNVSLNISNEFCNETHTELVNIQFPTTDTVSHTEVVCTSDMPYDFFGNVFDEYGRYISTLTNVDGCDSVVILTLVEAEDYYHNIVEIICPGETYKFGTQVLTGPGIYHGGFSSVHGCDSIVRLTLKFEDFQMRLNAYPNPAYEGELVTLQVHANQDHTIDTWLPSEMFMRPSHQIQKVKFDEAGTYTIEVNGTSAINCPGIAKRTIEILPIDPTVLLPNAFSPNGDGLNDVFSPQVLIERGYQVEDFSIYNRYGQLIFNSGGTSVKGWDGYFMGEPCPVDTYMYTLSVRFTNGELHKIQGDVHLLR